MDLGIKGKIALVTAASKGLGRGAAENLSAEGCRVAICARTKEEVERVAELARGGVTTHILSCFSEDPRIQRETLAAFHPQAFRP